MRCDTFVVLICIIIHDDRYFSVFLFYHCISFMKCLVKLLAYFSVKLVGFVFYTELKEFFIYHGYQSFARYIFYEYFLRDCGLSIHFLKAKPFNFDKAQFINFLMVIIFWVLSKNIKCCITCWKTLWQFFKI